MFGGWGGYVAPEPEPEEPEVVDGTAAWRYAAFRGLGFDIDASITLTVSLADWHDVGRAVANGCPLPVAVEIYT